MATLYDALIGDLSEKDYLSTNPYYLSGYGVGQMQLPKPTSNAEAIWGPVLQGALGGALRGYGQYNANQSAFTDIANNPLMKSLTQNIGPVASGDTYGQMLDPEIQAYAKGEMPDNFTIKQGKNDLILAAIQKEIADKEEEKKQEAKARIIQSLATQDPAAGAKILQNEYGVDLSGVGPIVDQSAELRKKQMEEIQQRFDEKQALLKSQTSFEGFTEPKTKPTPAEAAKVREELGNNAKLKDTLEVLKDSIDRDGFINLFGNDAQLQQALQSFIFNTQRKATGSGARLEGPEAKMIQAMTPAVASGDFAGAIKAALTGREPSQLATDMINVISKSENAMMKARYGAERINSPEAPALIMTKTLKDGSTVRVKRQPDGSYIEVE